MPWPGRAVPGALALRAWAKEWLPPYQVPHTFYLLDALPLLPTPAGRGWWIAEERPYTIGEIVDSGGSAIDAGVVIDAVTSELSEEVLSTVEEDFEEIPSCDYIQDRFLEGDGTTQLSVNTRTAVARITGRLTVTSGGHGEPGNVLGNPPIDVTITGGDWQKFEYSSKVRGENYSYKYWQKGTG